jgi:DNA-binding NarL/FixJ family response regulator
MPAKTLRIAIADDHAVVRAGYRRLLELDEGIEVVAEFADGESAYRWLCANPADILILDLSMPGRDGFATLQRLRYRVPSLRVLVFTMHDSPALAAQALRLGASGYVTKSSPPESLVDAVRSVGAGGCPLSEDVAQARQTNPPSNDLPHRQLSPREFDMFLLFAEGASVEEIAASRFLSAKTVANYQTTIRHKTGCANALAMYRYAQEHALLRGAVPAVDLCEQAASRPSAPRPPVAPSAVFASDAGGLL